jgi:peptidoglycan/xylan/chitin deacetylase (PgdA/CDA1 family)
MPDKPLKHILFTFDYELFLGAKSGSADKCVIEPTKKLVDTLNQYKVKAIFFIDITWLLRLKEISEKYLAAKIDYEKVIFQLRQIAGMGHYIFPHLHPHWADATYQQDTNQWHLLDYTKFRFHNISSEQREQLFDKSILLLKDILGQDYQPKGYRAGGWSIQPFDDFRPFFEKYGITSDFTVLPGRKFSSEGPDYDYSAVQLTQPYTFSKDITKGEKGPFTEFPITTIPFYGSKKILNRVLLKYLHLKGDTRSGDGNGVLAGSKEKPTSNSGRDMISIELLTAVKLPLYMEFLKRNNYLQMISHPKMLTPNNLATFQKFMRKVFTLYQVESDFAKFRTGK